MWHGHQVTLKGSEVPAAYCDGEEVEGITGRIRILECEDNLPVHILLQHPGGEHNEPFFIL